MAQFGQNKANVVAKDGLNIREEPNISSRVVYKAPFLSEVKIMEMNDTKLDTLETFTRYTNGRDYVDYVLGGWIKIEVEKYIGYAFSAYLIPLSGDYFKTEDLNNEYGLSFVGSNCVDNVHRNKKIKWMGMYKISGGYSLAEVDLNYFNDFQELTGFAISTTQNKNLILVIGHEEGRFQPGELNGDYFGWSSGKIVAEGGSKNVATSISFLEANKKESSWNLTIHERRGKQTLSKGFPNRILWRGDLDRDEKNDYIIVFGDQVLTAVLYLSSKAENGKLVKAVAEYYFGYCC
ncbi:MAG: SH3 domain-containing protein [Bacteroidota bacterium]